MSLIHNQIGQVGPGVISQNPTPAIHSPSIGQRNPSLPLPFPARSPLHPQRRAMAD